MKCAIFAKAIALISFGLFSVSVSAQNVYATYDVTGTEEVSENMFADQLNVSGKLIVKSNTQVSAGTLNLGGTASDPAILQVGGSSSKLYVTNIVIGANGGCGVLRSTGYWSSMTMMKELAIHENTPLSPDSQYVDFLEVCRYSIATGSGFFNRTEHPARIKFKKDTGNGLGWMVTGANWGAYLFREGAFVLEGVNKSPIWIQPGGGGTGFSPETYASKFCQSGASVKTVGECDVWLTNESNLRCLQVSNVEFMNQGRVLVTNVGVKITGSVTFGGGISSIEFGGSQEGYLDLGGNVLTGCTMRVASGIVKSSVKGGVLAFAPEAGENHSFYGNVDQSATVRMCGEGTLTLLSSSVPHLEVEKGVVRIADSNVSVSSLSVASGAGIVVDGCQFRCPSDFNCPAASITCVNGGTIVNDASVSLFTPDISGGISKSGEGAMIIYDPVEVNGLLHVAAGTLVFSREGFTKPYHRWTFKELSDNSTNPKVLILSELYLWGNDGNRVPASGTMTRVEGQPDPSTLPAGSVAWQCAVTYGTDKTWLMNIASIFTEGHNRPTLAAPVINPEDPSTWLSLAYHLPKNSTPVTHYDLCTEKCRPRTWTFEASDDGKNWSVVDDRIGVEPVDNTGGIKFFDGGEYTNPTKKFRLSGYVTKGVLNMPPSVSVRVDAGATLDFSSVEGGQGIDRITVGAASGCGSIVNAKVLPNGTLNLIADERPSGALDTQFAVAGLADVANFNSWKVCVNGKERSGWSVAVTGDTLSVLPPGMVVIIR